MADGGKKHVRNSSVSMCSGTSGCGLEAAYVAERGGSAASGCHSPVSHDAHSLSDVTYKRAVTSRLGQTNLLGLQEMLDMAAGDPFSVSRTVCVKAASMIVLLALMPNSGNGNGMTVVNFE
jgi:hypothetical protein